MIHLLRLYARIRRLRFDWAKSKHAQPVKPDPDATFKAYMRGRTMYQELYGRTKKRTPSEEGKL